MSGNDGNTNGGQGQGAGGEGGGTGGGQQQQTNDFKPVTFKTQDEMDAAFADRATRAATSAKAEVLKPFQELGVEPDAALEAYKAWKAAEDAKKDPAVLEREKNEQLNRELQEYKNKEARGKLAAEISKEIKIGDTPIPAELLAGSTKDEMVAHGNAIIAFFQTLAGQTGPRAPQFNPLQGTGGEQKLQAGDPLRNYFETGQFA